MNLESELVLSFYKELTDVGSTSNIKLVQHVETGIIYIKKTLSVYDAHLYKTLMKHRFNGIPEIYHVIEDEDKLIIIEEYINGQTLQDVINVNGPLELEAAIKIVKQLCLILHQLHSLNTPIIHRDIKPSNIILSGQNTVTLIDFNVSREYSADKKQDTIFMGTADYAAPEQYGFGQSDQRTDIYALGQLLNMLLLGTLAKDRIYNGKGKKIITKCTHIDPDKRFSSVQQLSYALDKLVSSPPVLEKKTYRIAPPGFRSRKPWKMVIALFGYLMIFYLTFAMVFEDVTDKADIYIYKTFLLTCALLIVAFITNYLNIRTSLPFSGNRNIFIRVLSAACWLSLFLLMLGITAAIIATII